MEEEKNHSSKGTERRTMPEGKRKKEIKKKKNRLGWKETYQEGSCSRQEGRLRRFMGVDDVTDSSHKKKFSGPERPVYVRERYISSPFPFFSFPPPQSKSGNPHRTTKHDGWSKSDRPYRPINSNLSKFSSI